MSDPTKGKADVAGLHRMIDELESAISPIVAAHSESETVHAEKRAAHIALVTKMLELAQPMVRALGTRPVIFHSYSHGGADNEEQLADWRGLILTASPDDKFISPTASVGASPPQRPVELSSAANVGPKSDGTTDFLQGTYDGYDVFLREDGQLMLLSYEGTWKKEPNHHGEWRATEQEITVETFCFDGEYRRQAADPKSLAAQLVSFVDKAGSRKKSMAKATAAATKFRAIAALL